MTRSQAFQTIALYDRLSVEPENSVICSLQATRQIAGNDRLPKAPAAIAWMMWRMNAEAGATVCLLLHSVSPVCHYPACPVRVGNHVVDAENQPWFYASTPGKSGGGLWHRSTGGSAGARSGRVGRISGTRTK
ncbi:MAG: hypothetical protein R2867_25335 [Caldilineaceae bacterium]